jgi:hypothetical protein
MGYEETGFSEAEWLRLAAPRLLPATVRAVMAVFVQHGFDVFDGGGTDLMITRETGEALLSAVRDWDAAGRPGLEEK